MTPDTPHEGKDEPEAPTASSPFGRKAGVGPSEGLACCRNLDWFADDPCSLHDASVRSNPT